MVRTYKLKDIVLGHSVVLVDTCALRTNHEQCKRSLTPGYNKRDISRLELESIQFIIDSFRKYPNLCISYDVIKELYGNHRGDRLEGRGSLVATNRKIQREILRLKQTYELRPISLDERERQIYADLEDFCSDEITRGLSPVDKKILFFSIIFAKTRGVTALLTQERKLTRAVLYLMNQEMLPRNLVDVFYRQEVDEFIDA